ncbi:glycine amidinotransferase [Mytilus galloprovincialis]|uniref:Glycine amidinotransferase n=1 Tax=Mytilus galloprovincialis TaxID=29158 RepID=A0A8B6BUW1_MYTGA|nr:glycine amidinotransferase [Mytilus galloprovincialis]
MKIVNSHNEWDPLEEIILGVPDFWCTPQKEPGYLPTSRTGKQSDEYIHKAALQIDNLERVLRFQCNVTVRRPDKIDFTQPVRTPFFSIEHQHGASCPRDTLLVIGNEIIESTMSSRARYFESMAYRTILNDYFEKDEDMLWTMAPKPTMSENMYNSDFPFDTNCQERKDWIQNYKYVINEAEPCFDAAEVLRLGKDLIVQQSMTANRKGIDWLRRHVKSRGYRVHEVHFPGDLNPVHIDASLVPLVPPTNERKGILVNPPDRPITKEDKDRIFTGSSWEILDAPFPNSMVVPESCESSAWLSINLLMVGPDKAIVEETEIPTINFLESLGIKCIRVPYRDSYRFGGSIHCQTSDVRRIGECHNYFPNMDSNENQTTTNS